MCSICGKNVDEPVELGPILEKKDLRVHYFCLLLSTHLLQNGQDASGILGFLIRDIRLEAENARKRICFYCKEIGASIKCNECPVYFHVLCGVTNKCLFQFVGLFHSFCRLHQNIKNTVTHENDRGCHICMEAMGQYHPVTSISAGCCSNGFAHRKCLQKYALCAGYYFKCVWCRSTLFRDEARLKGIFIPDRDAQWEREEKSFYGNFYKKYSICDAKICYCPRGRRYIQKANRSKWSLYVCYTCAATGIHFGCSNDSISDEYMCDSCKIVFNATLQTVSPALNFLNIDDKYDLTMYMTKTQIQFTTETYSHSVVLDEEEESHGTGAKGVESHTENLVQNEQIAVPNEIDAERMEIYYRYDEQTQLMTSVLGIPKESSEDDGLEFEKEFRHVFKPEKDREFYAFMNELFLECFECYKKSLKCEEIADDAAIPKNSSSDIRKMLPPRKPMRKQKHRDGKQFLF